MDITLGFGPRVLGSSPDEGDSINNQQLTINNKNRKVEIS